MTERPTLDLPALRRALNMCLDELSRQVGERPVLGHDGYWLIEPADAFDLGRTPTLAVGSLADDLDEIATLLAEPEELAIAPWHSLQHLLGPLTYLASATRP